MPTLDQVERLITNVGFPICLNLISIYIVVRCLGWLGLKVVLPVSRRVCILIKAYTLAVKELTKALKVLAEDYSELREDIDIINDNVQVIRDKVAPYKE